MLDPQIVSIIDHISPSGIGPDGPLFNEATLKVLAGISSAESKLLAIVHDKDAAADRRFVAAEALEEGDWTGWRAQIRGSPRHGGRARGCAVARPRA